jgi:lipopolysaccharide/colanic/teichoic acid biosynthesis glycosyltransferase
MQRIFDVIFSGIALFILAPLSVPLIVILRLTGEGEVFFLQSRVGRGGQLFQLYKFSTMLKDSPNMGTGTVTLHKDPRILPLGRWLRSTKINELPQILNIFFGDMSVIGPRPQTERCFDAFSESAQHEITKVRPGLSGVGSIVFRNEEEMMHGNNAPDKFYNQVVMPYKGRLEEWYVSNHNMLSYISLIGLTVLAIVFPNSRLIWKIFSDLPRPPKDFHKWM